MSERVVLDGPVLRVRADTCDPELPSVKCQARRKAEAAGQMRFNEQARGWEYPVPLVRKLPIETWEFCPFCLMPLPDEDVPRLARQIPYRPPVQPDNPK